MSYTPEDFQLTEAMQKLWDAGYRIYGQWGEVTDNRNRKTQSEMRQALREVEAQLKENG